MAAGSPRTKTSRRIRVSRELAVLMTEYNAEKTIRRALDGLARNAEPFDLLIVDDCSRLPLAEFLSSAGDGVEIIRPHENLGVAGAKNFGLARLLAKPYDFIAMMDADDISHPERLFDENTREVVYHFRPPCEPREICDALFFTAASCIRPG